MKITWFWKILKPLQGTGDYCNLIVMAQDTLQAANCCNTSLLQCFA